MISESVDTNTTGTKHLHQRFPLIIQCASYPKQYAFSERGSLYSISKRALSITENGGTQISHVISFITWQP